MLRLSSKQNARFNLSSGAPTTTVHVRWKANMQLLLLLHTWSGMGSSPSLTDPLSIWLTHPLPRVNRRVVWPARSQLVSFKPIFGKSDITIATPAGGLSSSSLASQESLPCVPLCLFQNIFAIHSSRSGARSVICQERKNSFLPPSI